MNGISRESAQNVVDELFEYYGVEEDDETEESLTKEEKAYRRVVQQAKKRLAKCIQKGAVEVDFGDSCVVTQHLKYPINSKRNTPIQDLVYHELNATAKVAMSKSDDGDFVGQQYHLLGSLSKQGYGGIIRLKIADLKVAETLGTIFLLLYGQ